MPFSRLDQAVKLRTGHHPSGRVTEQPVLSADDKRADQALGGVIVDRQISLLDVAFQLAPVAGRITDGFTQRILARDLWLRFLYPPFGLGQHRLTVRLAGQRAIFIAAFLKVALDAIELVDQIQCDVCTPDFALGLHFLRFNELAPCVRPAAQSLHSVLCGQRVVTGVVIGHDIAAIAIQHAHGHLLRSAGSVVEKVASARCTGSPSVWRPSTYLHRNDFKLFADFFTDGMFATATSEGQFMLGQFVDNFDARQISRQRLAFATTFGRRNEFLVGSLIQGLDKAFRSKSGNCGVAASPVCLVLRPTKHWRNSATSSSR